MYAICSMKNIEIGVFYQTAHGFVLLLFGQMCKLSRFMSITHASKCCLHTVQRDQDLA